MGSRKSGGPRQPRSVKTGWEWRPPQKPNPRPSPKPNIPGKPR